MKKTIQKKEVHTILQPSVDAWNREIVKQTKMIRFYQVAIIIMGIILLILFGQNSRLSEQRKTIPYIVEIDSNTGKPTFSGIIEEAGIIAITDSIARYQLTQYINNIRSISSDTIILKRNLQAAVNHSSLRAQESIAALVEEEELIAQIALGIRRDIRYRKFDKVGEQTWIAEWEETTRRNGAVEAVRYLSGTFSYYQRNPQSKSEAEGNPLGFYIDEYTVTEISNIF